MVPQRASAAARRPAWPRSPRTALLECIGLALCCARSLAGLALPLEFESAAGWEPRPSFLPNPAAGASVVLADGVVSLRVSEPGRGMKFELPMTPFRSTTTPYLVLRYRARDLAGGYALWIFDGSREGRQALSTADLIQDGQWHTLALGLRAAGVEGRIRSFLTEVQCQRAPAFVAFDWIRTAAKPPPDAVVQGGAAGVQRLEFPVEVLRQATARPGWLQEPASRHDVVPSAAGVRFQIEGGPGAGMKWAVALPAPVDLSPYRYVVLRYRARNLAEHSDYLLWFGSAEGGAPPQSHVAIRPADITSDGERHVCILPSSARLTVRELALQARTAGGEAELEVSGLEFARQTPLVAVRDLLPEAGDWRGGSPGQDAWAPLPLGAAGNAAADELAGAFGLDGWLAPGQNLVRGVPFTTPAGPGSAAMLDGLGELSIPIGAQARELFLLLGCDPTPEDVARMGNPVPLRAVREPERLRVRLEYGDGIASECFPVRLASGSYEVIRGLDVYCLPGLRDAELARLVLINRMDSALLMVGALTANTGPRLVPLPDVPTLPPAVPAIPAYPGNAVIRKEAWGYVVANDLIQLDLGVSPGITVRGLASACLGDLPVHVAPGPLFEVGVDDTVVGSDRLSVGSAAVAHEGDLWRLGVPVDGSSAGIPVLGRLLVTVGDADGIRLELDLRSSAAQPMTPTLRFPVLRDVQLGTAAATWYLYANRGGVISAAPARFREPSGGSYPLQVMSVFSPRGGALGLFTEDTADVYRFWELTKDNDGVDLALDVWRREVAPGEPLESVPVVLRAHTGDWRQSLRLYREWAQTWYRPQVPRKDWFRKSFYYQQTNAWGRLRDRATGEWRMGEEIRRYRDAFGCLDYLHIFDFGESRVYGRVGDYNHYDELGGLDALRGAILEAQSAGVRVGLYLEGYLCDERGVWGREHVHANDIREEKGTPLLWPGTPTEHMMCPASVVWREHLAATEQRVAAELAPDGLYTDQYGFINPWKTCWSRDHGHSVPSAPLRGERDTTRAIRAAAPAAIATLTEEVPNDLHAILQDGALAYSVTWADPRLSPHRVHLFRFLFPDFKTFQLVQYNPFTEGAWHLLKYPFFNGEGQWLHGTVPDAYCDDARQFLRAAFRVLNQYEAAFAADDVEPLVPTLWPAVYANRFGSGDARAWTLFNAGYQTYRGPVLRVRHRSGTQYVNALSEQPATAEMDKGYAVLSLELGPRGVGCLAAVRQP